MMLNDRLRLAFIHIPKSAGSTVMTALKPLNDLPAPDKIFLHPRRGPISGYHLPLDVLRDHFPDIFARLADYDSYALVRDPRARFVSAFLQHLAEFQNLRLEARTDLRAPLADVIRQLQAGAHHAALVHFQRQCDFIDLEGRRVIRNLYAVEDLPRMAQDMMRRHGVRIDGHAHVNRRRLHSAIAGDRMLRLARRARQALPAGLGEQIHRAWRAMAPRPPAPLYRALYADGELAHFVDRHYADDAALYRMLTARYTR